MDKDAFVKWQEEHMDALIEGFLKNREEDFFRYCCEEFCAVDDDLNGGER